MPSSVPIKFSLVWKVYVTPLTLEVNWVFLGNVSDVGLDVADICTERFKSAFDDEYDLGT